MKYLATFFLIIAISSKLNAQLSAAYIDSVLNAYKNSDLGRIKTGTNAIGAAFFYLKENKKMISIVERDQHNFKGTRADSITSNGYYFFDDKLVKIYVRWWKWRSEKGEANLYFENDRLIERNGQSYSGNEIRALMDRAYALLAEGNLLIRRKFKDR